MQPILSKTESYAAVDGTKLYLRRFLKSEAPAANVVVLHGIISHSGWYLRCGEDLAARGWDAHFLDRRGSGMNAERRGDIDQMSTWISDVVTYLEQLPRDQPTILLGISWGGKLAPVIARLRPDLVSAMGMLCPGLYARQQPGLLSRIAVETAVRCKLADRHVTIPLQRPSLFTEVSPWQTYIGHDPLTLREITLRFAREDRKLTLLARNSHRWIRTPSLLVLSGRDQMVNNQRTRDYFSRFLSSSKTVIEYPHAAHTLEFEPNPQPFFDDLAGWIIRRSKP